MVSRPTERIEQIKTGFRIRPRYIILFFILTIFVLGGVYLSQRTKLSSIAEEKIELQTKLDTKKVEQERLERMAQRGRRSSGCRSGRIGCGGSA